MFYREHSIGTYFNTRLLVFAAVNEHREQLVTWAGEGVRFHDLHITIPSVESDDDTPDPPSANSDPLQWYIQTETISLQHHVLETLLRLYTGLVEATTWLDPLITLSDRDSDLPALIKQHLTGGSKPMRDLRSDVSYLLLGQREVPEDDPDRVASIDNLSGILQMLAHKWLDGRRAYNAVKHGLLISQSNASLSVGLAPQSMVTVGDGPSIAYLNHTKWKPQPRSEGTKGGKVRDWTIETQWIRFEEASKVIAVACELITCMIVFTGTRHPPRYERRLLACTLRGVHRSQTTNPFRHTYFVVRRQTRHRCLVRIRYVESPLLAASLSSVSHAGWSLSSISRRLHNRDLSLLVISLAVSSGRLTKLSNRAKSARCASGRSSTVTAAALQIIAPSKDGLGTCPLKSPNRTGNSSVLASA
ncbi:MAG: hypothetical protein F4163_03130 [Acidimicrobiaceae bacterium]|nr:hypothetical protein [Acidimicrobiaceae bacterium]